MKKGKTAPDEEGKTASDEEGKPATDEEGTITPDEEEKTTPDEEGNTAPEEERQHMQLNIAPPSGMILLFNDFHYIRDTDSSFYD